MSFLRSQGLAHVQSEAYNTIATRQNVVEMCVDALTRELETAELHAVEASVDNALEPVSNKTDLDTWIAAHRHLPHPTARFVDFGTSVAGS